MVKKATPHDLEAERAVLGGVIISNEGWLEVCDILYPQDFYRHVHRILFRVLGELHAADLPIDFITIKRALERENALDEVGVSYLAGLVDGVPKSTNVRYYADIVADLADRRQLQSVCQQGLLDAQEAKTAEDAATQLVAKAREAVRVRGDTGQSLETAIRHLIQSLDNPVEATPTGLSTLDGLGSGFRPGELTLLAGRPSHGKTALALQLAKAAASAATPLPVWFASLEMTREALTMRWLASDARVWFSALRGGTLTPTEYTKVSASVEHLSSLPIRIDDHASIGIGDLRRSMVGSTGGLLIVDYLQLVQPLRNAKWQSRTQEVGAISRGLIAIAHDCRVSVLALSQLNREVEHRGGDPRLSDLRDSGELEQDSDQVWLLSRPSLSEGSTAPEDLAVLRIAKHRNGPLGKVDLHFDGARQTFRERTAEDVQAPTEAPDESKMKAW